MRVLVVEDVGLLAHLGELGELLGLHFFVLSPLPRPLLGLEGLLLLDLLLDPRGLLGLEHGVHRRLVDELRHLQVPVHLKGDSVLVALNQRPEIVNRPEKGPWTFPCGSW